MKTILIPTDFSENAKNAIEYAIEMAKKEKAKIIIVHACYITYIAPDAPAQYLTEELVFVEDAAKKEMQKLIKKIENEGILCEAVIKQDNAIDLILEEAIKRKPDLIVMGTKGATGLKEVIIGSNTARVIEKVNCPVIAVPEKSSFKPIKHIVYATNYLLSDIDALKNLVNIAELFNAEITLLHVSNEALNHETEEDHILKFRSKIKSRIDYDKVRFKLVYGKIFENVLAEYIKRESPDLLAMSTHHRTVYDKLFGKSFTKKMAYHTNIPLLAFHYKQDPVIFI